MKNAMENKSKIGKAFADGFKDFTLEPGVDTWKNISKEISSGYKFGFTKKFWVISVISAVIIASFSSYYIILNNKNQNSSPKVTMVESPVKKIETTTNPLADQTSQLKNENREANTKAEVSAPQKGKDIVRSNANKSADDVEIKPKTSDIKPFNQEEEHYQIPVITNNKANVEENSNTPKTESLKTTKEEKSIIQMDSNIKFSNNPVICFGESARLEVYGGEYYLWNTGCGASVNTVEPVSNTTYTVTVTDKYNYKHIHDFHVTIDKECTTVFVPSAFTPNGDGNNDIFKAVGENILEFSMHIISRDGRILFSTTDINTGWDGTFNGELMSPQVFIYKVFYKNGRGVRNVANGQFTLLR